MAKARKQNAPEAMQQSIKGTVSRRIFYNNDNGYCVLSVELESCEEIKATGNMPSVREGDEYEFIGQWIDNPKYGKQFRFQASRLILPSGTAGAAQYLSNVAHGVGIKKAEKIVAQLGEDALSRIQEDTSLLDKLDFLDERQRREIAEDLTKNSVQAELAGMICKPGTGIGMGTVAKIMNKYGPDAIRVIKENPYILSQELWGVGFIKADIVAQQAGIKPSSEFRVEAAVDYILREAGTEGHVYLRPRDIMGKAIGKKGIIEASGVTVGALAKASQKLIDGGRSVREGDAIYSKKLWLAECGVAAAVRMLLARDVKEIEGLDAQVSDVESRDGIEYAKEQRDAVKMALREHFSIITGGPGTGKTTVINAVCDIYKRVGPTGGIIYLAAPTGRAAKRMSEATGHDASTIHRLLRYNPSEGGFEYGRGNPLIGPGLMIIDESSMMDVELADSLLAAVDNLQVVFVGDIDQLPSVGPGSVLRDCIGSGRAPTVRLRFNYRQAGGSKVAEYANLVCQGVVPPLDGVGGGAEGCEPCAPSDFSFIPVEDAAQAQETILGLVRSIVSEGYGLLEWAVLAPMRRGDCGITKLNELVREIVNPMEEDKSVLGSYRCGDKVMVIKNNYKLGVFNGDVGVIRHIDKGKMLVDFGDFRQEFAVEDLDLLTLAYSSTIHKCVALDTMIETDRGLIRIEDAEFGTVAAIDGTKAYTKTPVFPEQEMLQITTEDGYRLTVTPDHGMDVWDGERYSRAEVQHLSTGDWLQIGLGVRCEPKNDVAVPPQPKLGDVRERHHNIPAAMSEDLAEFIGLMVADGTVFKGGFRLGKKHPEVTERYATLCLDLFGYRAKRWEHNGTYFADVYSRYLVRWLVSVGGMAPHKKAVPVCVLAGTSKHHRAFLRGLFEDAAVNLRTGNENMVDHIDFTTCMERLAVDVQIMLARLGIVSNHVRNVSLHSHSKVYIYGEYARIFGQSVGFISQEKQRRCLLKAGKQTRYVIPLSDKEIDEIFSNKDNGLTESDRGNVKFRSYITRNKFCSMKNAPEWLKERCASHHSRIVAIEKVVVKSTCLNVPEGHRFLQNAISGWNSQGSEFPIVIMPLVSQHYIMQIRNLLYTGMTRAKKQLYLVADEKSVRRAVKNNVIEDRFSLLAKRIRGEV